MTKFGSYLNDDTGGFHNEEAAAQKPSHFPHLFFLSLLSVSSVVQTLFCFYLSTAFIYLLQLSASLSSILHLSAFTCP
jgi:hypothetical protein